MSPLAIIFVTVFIDLIGFGIIIPLLPFYAESYGASALAIGLLGSVFSLMQFVFSPIWGRWSDRIGRRPIILMGLVGSAVSYLALAQAESLALIFLARVIGGIAGANVPTAQAYIADITTPENRAKGLGLVGVAFGLGFVFGPAIGGGLSHFGPEAPMYFAAALSIANFTAAWFFLPESRTGHGKAAEVGRIAALRRALARPQLVLLLSLYFIIMAAFSGFEATFALFSERRFGFTAATIGYLFAFIGVVLAVVQGLLVGRAVRLIGEHRVVPIAVAVIALGLGLVPLATSVPLLLVALGTLATGIGFNGPSLTSMVSRLSDPNDQGGILGVAQSLAALGRIVGPAWGGFLFDRYGMTIPYISSAAIMTVAFVVALVSLARHVPAEMAPVGARS
ncbi:MAG: MFS transporter [Vicinamibacterales bacterium]|nr:MFS transporter [Vicinamibacterales bacterium]